ncbi:MAG: diguanylate cyclase [Candidatus Neomarinimicrobiota bacterium]
MRFPKLPFNSARLWFITLVIALFILLFIFPKPEGNVFLAARIIVTLGIILILFWPDERTATGSTAAALPGSSGSGRSLYGNHEYSRSHQYYEQLLQNVFEIIQSLNEDFHAAVYMIDPASSGYTLQVASGGSFLEYIPIDNAILNTLIKSDEGMIFQQKDVQPAWSNLMGNGDWRGSECLIGTRIIYRNVTVGCLLIHTSHFNLLEQNSRDVITDLGVFISQGIDRIERIEELSADRENHAKITTLMEKIDIADEYATVFESIRNLCRSLFSYDKLTISIAATNTSLARIMLSDGFSEDISVKSDFDIADTLHGRPIRTEQPINSSYWEKDYPDEGRFVKGDIERFNFMAVVGVPLKIGTSGVGAIVLERLSSRQFSESDLWLLKTLSINLGAVLHWSDKYRAMHQSATHDGLTELLNHKSFLDRFEEEISRSLRFQQDLVLLMMDLDKFKRINDNHGHLYGDYVLQEVSHQLKLCIRNIDVIARYGGEEFAILLINTDKQKAQAVANRIVNSIGGYKFRRDGVEVRMTISVGLSQFPADADRIKDMIAKADAAMYRVKARGGNSFASHEQASG